MNTAILSSGGGNVGIGFAIPISMVKEIADQLIAHGKVSRGELGVIIQDLTPGIASAMGLKINSGALVADVMPGSAAAAAGLKSGDVVTALNGQPVHDSAELRNRVGGMQPGTKVQLTVLRDGSQHPVEATLRTETARPSEAAASSGGQAGTEPELGMQLGPIPADTADAGNLQGAYVTAVLPGSAAEDAGIQAGDIITEVAGKTVSSPQEAASLLRNRPKGKPVLIRIRRDQASLFVALG
jgi:S1-C subfamily serine protease